MLVVPPPRVGSGCDKVAMDQGASGFILSFQIVDGLGWRSLFNAGVRQL